MAAPEPKVAPRSLELNMFQPLEAKRGRKGRKHRR